MNLTSRGKYQDYKNVPNAKYTAGLQILGQNSIPPLEFVLMHNPASFCAYFIFDF